MSLSTILLENETFALEICPALGAKVVSLVAKQSGRNLLFESVAPLRLASYGAAFSDFDTSGIDDCFPTIDPWEEEGLSYPDHGALWSHPMDATKKENALTSRFSLEETLGLPITGERTIALDRDKVFYTFTVENHGDAPIPYIWAFHGLFSPEGAKLLLPFSNEDVILLDGKMPEGLEDFSSYPENATSKWAFPGPCPEGEIGYLYEKDGFALLLDWDRTETPYLACWVSTGGFKGEKNWALEPMSAAFDTPGDRPHLPGSTLFPHESRTHHLTLTYREVRHG